MAFTANEKLVLDYIARNKQTATDGIDFSLWYMTAANETAARAVIATFKAAKQPEFIAARDAAQASLTLYNGYLSVLAAV